MTRSTQMLRWTAGALCALWGALAWAQPTIKIGVTTAMQLQVGRDKIGRAHV